MGATSRSSGARSSWTWKAPTTEIGRNGWIEKALNSRRVIAIWRGRFASGLQSSANESYGRRPYA